MHLHVEFSDGQTRDIPLSTGHVLQVHGAAGIEDSVSFDGVDALELAHGEPEVAAEPEAEAAKPDYSWPGQDAPNQE